MLAKLAGLVLAAALVISAIPRPDEPLGRGVYSAPAWSPNGDYLAFTFNANGTSYANLWLFETKSGRYTKLYDEQDVAWYSGLAWQYDDILWFLTSSFGNTLHSINIASHKVDEVIDTSLWHGFTFYPDQQHIIFAEEMQILQFFAQDLFPLDLTTGSIIQKTDTTNISERAPLASPDEQRLAVGGKGGVEIEATSSNIYSVPQVYGDVNRYDWSPDGCWFLYVDNPEPGLYLARSNGEGTPRKISSDDAAYVSWSPNGAYIAYTTFGLPDTNELHIVPAGQLNLTLPISPDEN